MIHNILISLIILLLVLINSFAMYLPLMALIKDKEIALRYAIPLSFSVEVLFGYIYYCTSTMSYFPICYLIFALFLNILAYIKLKPIAFTKINVNWVVLVTLFISLITIIYTRYYDSFKFIGPGNNDTYYHLIFVKDLFNPGYLSSGFYAPGFHIILMPIAKLVPFADLYRFTGPAIGIVSVISFVLLLKDYLRSKILLLFLLALLVLPVYNQFTLQTIGFFSSSLTFIYFTSFVVLSSDKDINKKKINLCLFLIFTIALALTVPYLFVAIFPAFLIFFFIVLIFKKNFHKKYPYYLFLINLILILGFLVSFGHVFLQSKVLKRSSGFPVFEVTLGENALSNEEIAESLYLPDFIKNNHYLKPIIGTGYDLLRVKSIRSVKSTLGLGAYIWSGLSIFLIVYAIRKKNSILLALAILSVFFGVCVQTGMFEISNYRGRSGWYLLLLSIFSLVLFTDQIYSKKIPYYLIAICILLSATGFFFPPKFSRSYYEEEFNIVSQVARQCFDKNITLIASDRALSMVAENITSQGMNPDLLQNENSIVIIEKEILHFDSEKLPNTTKTDNRFEERKEQLNEDIEIIKQNENFNKYNKFFENENFIVYKNINLSCIK